MKLTLLAATIAALTLTACGKPNQALPEQEKENYSKIMQQSPGQDQSAAGSDTSSNAESGTADSGK
jgi:hypothetical protein